LGQESANGLHSVAFSSLKFSSAKKIYPVHEQELLSIFDALKEWLPYLHGRRCEIKTGHHALRYLDEQTNLFNNKIRLMKTLQKYDCEIVYEKGNFNVVTDALSRINESPSTERHMWSE
jgi:hypothetical protein